MCGFDVVQFPHRVRDKIGWMPDNYGRYTLTTVADYLDFYTRAYGYRGAERAARIKDVMAYTDLTPLAQQDLDTLSKGQAQRVCLSRPHAVARPGRPHYGRARRRPRPQGAGGI